MLGYREESKILAKPFIFISYCHSDAVIVLHDVGKLMAMGVNLWYDVNMECGEDWSHRAQRIIEHENCVGTIFYNSAASFLSNAVQKERVMTLKKLEFYTNDEKEADNILGFFYTSVNIGDKSTGQYLQEAYACINGRDMQAMENMLPLSTVITLASMFRSELLYIPRPLSSSDEAVAKIYDRAKKSMATNDLKIMLQTLLQEGKLTQLGKNYLLEYGSYIYETSDLSSYIFFDSSRITQNGREYIEREDGVYTLEPVEWLYYKCNGDILYFISSKILASNLGDGIMEKWLYGEFSDILKGGSSKLVLEEMRFVSVQEAEELGESILKTVCVPYISPIVAYWWLKDDGEYDYTRKAVNAATGGFYHKGYNKKTSILGYRPVIGVKFDSLLNN